MLGRDLTWFFMEAELEDLLPRVSQTVMHPLRAWLDQQGLTDHDQPIALIACGRLGALPLHAAPVRDHRGHAMPFQETCELSYQASARTLGAARAALQQLPKAGPVLAVGNPQPTSATSLKWAEAEAEAIVDLAIRTGRAGSRALLKYDATKSAVLSLLRTIREEKPGAWVEIASHGHADPADPADCFMLLGGTNAQGRPELLTLAELQRSRLLEGVRLFNASGCTTGVGDLDTAPDELSSFAAGVLQAGAAAAIATQWSVDDRATFLLMLRFAQVMLGDPSITPARALHEAASWLRQATWDDLEALANKGLRKLRPIRPSRRDARDAVRGLTTDEATAARDARFPAEEGFEALAESVPIGHGRERPFDHPIYWACAVVFGA